MNLPRTQNPQAYAGSYVVDLGGEVAMGYSAEQVAIILESARYADAKVYKVVRAYPDGRMEIRGVDRSRFHLEDGLFFYRQQLDQARADFETLKQAAQQSPPPCRATWHLAKTPDSPLGSLTALIFPAEYTDEIADWLTAISFEGGHEVAGGISRITGYRNDATVLARHQFWPAQRLAGQTAEQVLAHPKVQAG